MPGSVMVHIASWTELQVTSEKASLPQKTTKRRMVEMRPLVRGGMG